MKRLMTLIILLWAPFLYAYECTIQTEFFRTLPVFLGTTGTMDISSENILVVTNRGTGVLTEKKANVTRYYYPGERIEAHIIKTVEENGDILLTTAPKYFNCNVRHAVIRQNRILSLSYCSVDGCRHINPEVCKVLLSNFSEEKFTEQKKNPLVTAFETETQLRAMNRSLHQDGSILMKEFLKLEPHSPRVIGVSMTDFETEEGLSATFGLLKLGSILASETQYCRLINKQNLFWKPDQLPSKFWKKPE